MPRSTCTSRPRPARPGALWLLGALLVAGTVLVAGAVLAAAPATEATGATPSFLEGELKLAASGAVYLVLKPPAEPGAGGSLEVRCRGVRLQAVALSDAAITRYRPFFASSAAPTSAASETPRAWMVIADGGAQHRRLVAPGQLRPLPSDDEQAAAASGADPESTTDDPPITVTSEVPEPPASYSIDLRPWPAESPPADRTASQQATDSAPPWRLLVDRHTASATLPARLLDAWAEGWAGLRGRDFDQPRLLELATTEAEAKRLYHLFQPGTVLLLDPGAGDAPPAATTATSSH